MKNLRKYILLFLMVTSVIIIDSCSVPESNKITDCTVTYRYINSYGESISSSLIFPYGEQITLLELPDYYNRKGYAFKNWQNDEENTFAAGEIYTVTKDVVFTAQYEEAVETRFYYFTSDCSETRKYKVNLALTEDYVLPSISEFKNLPIDETLDVKEDGFLNWTVITGKSVKVYESGESIAISKEDPVIIFANYSDSKYLTLVYDYSDGTFKEVFVRYYEGYESTPWPVNAKDATAQLFGYIKPYGANYFDSEEIVCPTKSTIASWISYRFDKETGFEEFIPSDSNLSDDFFWDFSKFGTFDTSVIIRPMKHPSTTVEDAKKIEFHEYLEISNYSSSLYEAVDSFLYLPESAESFVVPGKPRIFGSNGYFNDFDNVYVIDSDFSSSSSYPIFLQNSVNYKEWSDSLKLDESDFEFKGWFQYDFEDGEKVDKNGYDMNSLDYIPYYDGSRLYQEGETVMFCNINMDIPFYGYWILTDTGKQKVQSGIEYLKSLHPDQ